MDIAKFTVNSPGVFWAKKQIKVRNYPQLQNIVCGNNMSMQLTTNIMVLATMLIPLKLGFFQNIWPIFIILVFYCTVNFEKQSCGVIPEDASQLDTIYLFWNNICFICNLFECYWNIHIFKQTWINCLLFST